MAETSVKNNRDAAGDVLSQSPAPASATPGKGIEDDNQTSTRKFLIATDFTLLLATSLLSLVLRVHAASSVQGATLHLRFKQFGMLLIFSVLVLVFCELNGLYDQRWIQSTRFCAWKPMKSICAAALVLTAGVYLSEAQMLLRQGTGLAIAAGAITLIAWKYLWQLQSIEGINERRNVVIVGAGQVALDLREYLNNNEHLGYVVKGFLDRRLRPRPSNSSDPEHILGKIDDLDSIARRHFIDEVVITDVSNRELVKDITARAASLGLNVRIIPDLYDGLAMGARTEQLGQFPSIAIFRRHVSPLQLILKRLLDIVLSATTLILLFPVMVVIAIAIKLDSKGPVFYSSARVGKKGKIFRCHKFRTMVVNAEALKNSLSHLNERKGILFKISDDPRITPLGRFLRKMSLDELPQLWNVLNGEMSLVGPRPPLPSEYNEYALEHLRRLDVLPGITGLWQVKARNSPSFQDYINLDLEYVQKRSLWFDAVILAQTVRVVLTGTGS